MWPCSDAQHDDGETMKKIRDALNQKGIKNQRGNEFTFVNAIYLYDDKMLIMFNYKDSTKTITFDEANTALTRQNTGSTLDCSGAPKFLILLYCIFLEADMQLLAFADFGKK